MIHYSVSTEQPDWKAEAKAMWQDNKPFTDFLAWFKVEGESDERLNCLLDEDPGFFKDYMLRMFGVYRMTVRYRGGN